MGRLYQREAWIHHERGWEFSTELRSVSSDRECHYIQMRICDHSTRRKYKKYIKHLVVCNGKVSDSFFFLRFGGGLWSLPFVIDISRESQIFSFEFSRGS